MFHPNELNIVSLEDHMLSKNLLPHSPLFSNEILLSSDRLMQKKDWAMKILLGRTTSMMIDGMEVWSITYHSIDDVMNGGRSFLLRRSRSRETFSWTRSSSSMYIDVQRSLECHPPLPLPSSSSIETKEGQSNSRKDFANIDSTSDRQGNPQWGWRKKQRFPPLMSWDEQTNVDKSPWWLSIRHWCDWSLDLSQVFFGSH